MSYGSTSKAILSILATASGPMTARDIGLAAEVDPRDVHISLKRFATMKLVQKTGQSVKVYRGSRGSFKGFIQACQWVITPLGRLAATSPTKRLSPEQLARWSEAGV